MKKSVMVPLYTQGLVIQYPQQSYVMDTVLVPGDGVCGEYSRRSNQVQPSPECPSLAVCTYVYVS